MFLQIWIHLVKSFSKNEWFVTICYYIITKFRDKYLDICIFAIFLQIIEEP